jgi:DNA polymerase IV
MRRSDARAILHVDMDAFYASVEEHDRPELKGKPLIVGGSSARGVVAAANYVVRRFGVHSAMPIRDALRRCPHAICIKPRMARYKEVSEQIFAIFGEFTPLVEGLSLDEAFLDVTASRQLLGEPEVIGSDIRRRIAKQTGLTASVGIGPNKLLAKIASDLNKPDGMYRIGWDNVHRILDPLPVEKLLGVGQKSLPAVHAAGIHTFGELRIAKDAALRQAFGRHGSVMRDRASGIDERPVEPAREEQSISAEETFAADIREAALLRVQLLQLADRAASRLRSQTLLASTVTVKIRRADFRTFTRQRAIGSPTHDTARVAATALSLLDEWLSTQPDTAVRLLGVGVSDLRAQQQQDLFPSIQPARDSRLDSAIDDIRDRFGSAMVTRASFLLRSNSSDSDPAG